MANSPNFAKYLRRSDLAIVDLQVPRIKAYPKMEIVGSFAHWRNVRPGASDIPAKLSVLTVPLAQLVIATFSKFDDILKVNYESPLVNINLRVPTEFPQFDLAPQVNQIVLSAENPPIAPVVMNFPLTMVADEKELLVIDGNLFCVWRRWDGTLRAIAWKKFLAQDKNELVF